MPGPIATEVTQGVLEGLSSPEHPMLVKTVGPVPVMPTEPVPTFPSVAPPGSPPPTPQPTYQVSNPNSWLGVSPSLGKLLQFGFAGLVAAAFWWLLSANIGNQNDSQKAANETAAKVQTALVEAFREAQKERGDEVRTLTTGIMRSQTDLQAEIRGNTEAIRGVIRSIEKLDAKIEGKKFPIQLPAVSR